MGTAKSRERRVWRVELLGELRATSGDSVLTRFRTEKTAGLLAFLAHHANVAHAREVLTDAFWPEDLPEAGRHSLSQALSSLRCQLEPPGTERGSVIVADRASVQLAPEACTTDVSELRAAIKAASTAKTSEKSAFLERAVELYRGELLPGHYFDWVAKERDRLRATFVRAAVELAADRRRRGDLAGAAIARRAIAADPVSEEACRELMDALVDSKEPLSALRAFHELDQATRRELGRGPSSSLIERARAIERLAGQAPAPVRVSPRPSSPQQERPEKPAVPRPIARFFGREDELARLREVLAPGASRLVTITGPGGMGKSSLALDVLAKLEKRDPARVWFVALSDLAEAALVPTAIAQALRLEASRQDPVERVVKALEGTPALLVLDNFEHLVEGAAPIVRTLLERVPALTCLVTSRRRLGLAGEREVPLAPLPTPAADAALEALDALASVRVFLDRAQAVRPDFQLTKANAPEVKALVRRLEGVPLALTLAAGFMQVLSPEQILSKLSERLDVLAARDRDAPARHRTLRATFEASHRLLAPEVQKLFQRLSVFRGGFTLEAAEALGSDLASPVIDQLADLREASLLSLEMTRPGPRFRMLEMLREFALDQLSKAELASAREKHAEYFRGVSERAFAGRRGPEQAGWIERLEADLDNLRAAVEWSRGEGGRTSVGLEVAGNVAHFWLVRGLLDEGRRTIAQLLARSSEKTAARAAALHGGGLLATDQGDDEAARALLEEALALSREVDRPRVVLVLNGLGVLALKRGDHRAARPCFEEGLALARELGVPAPSLAHNLAQTCIHEGDFATARARHTENLAFFKSQGDRQGVIGCALSLGTVCVKLGDLEAARAHLEESLAEARALGYPNKIAGALFVLGVCHEAAGDGARARASFQESLDAWRKLGSKPEVGELLALLATSAASDGALEPARAWLEEARAIVHEVNDPVLLGHVARARGTLAFHQGDFEDARARCREHLALLEKRGAKTELARAWEEIATIEHALGQSGRAARLIGAARALREAHRTPVPPGKQASHAALIEALRAKLGASALEVALEAGRTLSIEEVCALGAHG